MKRIIIVGKNSEFPRFTPRVEVSPKEEFFDVVLEKTSEVMLTLAGLAIFTVIAAFFWVIA